jgi:23S rRNA (adenine2030-N6)-methyltransferase
VVGALSETGEIAAYPGSPAIARAWLRPQYRLIACEIEPRAADALARNMRGDPRIKTQIVDGWTALTAYVPPQERRGLVLVDPPFEEERDFTRLAQGLAAAHRKWATGIYMLWYPTKGRRAPDALAKQLRRLGIGKVLRAELTIAPLSNPARLNGCGLILVNPPWTLEGELSALLPVLAQRLGRAGKDRSRGDFRLDWLAGERPAAAR